MKNKLLFTRSLGLKLMAILFALLLYSGGSWGQATLPVTATFSTVTTSGPGTMPTGFTQSGLGGYAGSLKFDTQGDWLQLNFTGTPGTLTFDLGVNNSFPGTIPTTATFTVEESSNGTNWSPIGTYSNVAGGTKSISTINSSTQYIRWFYTTKPSGTNIALKNIGLTAVITTPTTQAHDITFSTITTSGMKIDWTNGNGSSRAVFVKETSGTITNPVDGTAYTASADWSSKGTQLGTSGYYCVYNGTGATATLTNLVAGTAYYVQVFEYNGTGATSKYFTATATNNPNNQSTSAASSPTITVVGTINAFANTVINTISTEQNYTVEGSNLTDNIIVTPPVGFEISKSTGTGFVANPSTLSFTPAEVATPQTVYVRFAPTAAQAYSGNITHASTGATQMDKAVSGTGIKAEPTNHVTFFDAVTGTPSYSAIIVSWTDATVAILPDGYLIKGSSVGYGSITDPVDGTAESDGGLVKNITQGTEIYEFTGLSSSTPYYFKIYPYTNSGSIINYKTDPTIPEATATTDAQPVSTYTWNVASGNWNTAASWTPVRTFPATSDILIFDGTTQASPTVTLDFTSPQSIGRLRIINNASVTFGTSATTRTLNIGYTGATVPQLEITAGATLTVSAANALTMNVTSGYTGSISGNMIFQSAAHLLKAADASGITFNNGSSFTAGTGFSGNAFGTTPYNTIVFASGSTYNQEAGSNPFGAGQPNSVVVFQTGSLYKLKSTGSPSVNGRIFANFEIDAAGFSNNLTGSAGFTMDNLILTNSTSVGMNFTGAMNIKGNISVNGGTLSFSPASATNVNLNGSSTQTISGVGTLTISSNANFVVANTVIADRNITFGGNLSINSGKLFTINAGKQITVTGALTNTENSGLVIKSDATGTGSLITSSSPNATVERYITGAAESWHLLSSPVSAQPITGGFTPVGTYVDGSGYDFYKWQETSNTWINKKNTTTSPTWLEANGDNNFGVGSGYLVSYQATIPTLTFTGALNAGDKILTCTNTPTKGKGWNLLGNPFASAIDWDYIKNNGGLGTGMDDALYYYDDAVSNYKYYLQLSGETGAIGGGQQYIPAMQGFMVHANTDGASITLLNSARTHLGQSVFYKSTNSVPGSLSLKVSVNGYEDEAYIHFNQNATTAFDGHYDAFKLKSYSANVPSIYTVASDGNQLAINGLPEVEENNEILVYFEAGTNGQYSITANLQNLPEANVYLVDNKLSKTQNLSDNPVYTFTASTTDEPNRFKLTFKSVGIGETVVEQPISIYATNNTVNVANTSATSVKGEVYVYNTLGQVMAHQNLNGDLTKINFAAATGYYLVKVITKETTFTGKVFVKQ